MVRQIWIDWWPILGLWKGNWNVSHTHTPTMCLLLLLTYSHLSFQSSTSAVPLSLAKLTQGWHAKCCPSHDVPALVPPILQHHSCTLHLKTERQISTLLTSPFPLPLSPSSFFQFRVEGVRKNSSGCKHLSSKLLPDPKTASCRLHG